MKRKLTWKQAWMKLHLAWKKTQINHFGYGAVQVITTMFQNPYGGLCPMISDLEGKGKISENMGRAMLAEVSKLPDIEDDPGFKFTTDTRGARQRAAFCLRMARKKEPR